MKCVMCHKELEQIEIEFFHSGTHKSYKGFMVFDTKKQHYEWVCGKRCVKKFEKNNGDN